MFVIKPNKELVTKAERILEEEYFDKYQYFKRLNEMFNEIVVYREKTFNKATEYLSNHSPFIQSVCVRLDPSIEKAIEALLKKQQDIFSVKEMEEIYYEKK